MEFEEVENIFEDSNTTTDVYSTPSTCQRVQKGTEVLKSALAPATAAKKTYSPSDNVLGLLSIDALPDSLDDSADLYSPGASPKVIRSHPSRDDDIQESRQKITQTLVESRDAGESSVFISGLEMEDLEPLDDPETENSLSVVVRTVQAMHTQSRIHSYTPSFARHNSCIGGPTASHIADSNTTTSESILSTPSGSRKKSLISSTPTFGMGNGRGMPGRTYRAPLTDPTRSEGDPSRHTQRTLSAMRPRGREGLDFVPSRLNFDPEAIAEFSRSREASLSLKRNPPMFEEIEEYE